MSIHTLPSRDAISGVRDRISLREAVVLADVEEKPIRKDIDGGILVEPSIGRAADGRISLEWHAVFIIAAVYGNRHLSRDMRKIAINRIGEMYKKSAEPDWWNKPLDFANFENFYTLSSKSIDIGRFVTLDLFTACHNVFPRVMLYIDGLKRIQERNDILGGEAVFSNSRLPVTHVGKMLESGENVANIIEDYPYLNEHDVKFAALYYKSHPMTGRPRKMGGEDGVSLNPR